MHARFHKNLVLGIGGALIVMIYAASFILAVKLQRVYGVPSVLTVCLGPILVFGVLHVWHQRLDNIRHASAR